MLFPINHSTCRIFSLPSLLDISFLMIPSVISLGEIGSGVWFQVIPRPYFWLWTPGLLRVVQRILCGTGGQTRVYCVLRRHMPNPLYYLSSFFFSVPDFLVKLDRVDLTSFYSDSSRPAVFPSTKWKTSVFRVCSLICHCFTGSASIFQAFKRYTSQVHSRLDCENMI